MSEQIEQKKLSLKEEVSRAEKCSETSNFIVEKILDPISMLFTKLFVKMNIHPNVVTILSMIIGVLGGCFFYHSNIWYNIIGIFLEFISVVLDGSDGQVARITNKKSKLGRVLDGISDGFVYISMYVFISLRLMNEPIPFAGGVTWGYWIWLISLFCGFVLHAGQARIADYYKNIHMFFKNNEHGNDLDLSKNIKKENANTKGKPFKRITTGIYYFYTKLQEMRTPKMQKLLNAVDDTAPIPADVSEYFITRSKKAIKLANYLTYVFRTIVLFILILVKQPVFIFPFLLVVLEPIKFAMICKYEKIAENTYNLFYKNK